MIAPGGPTPTSPSSSQQPLFPRSAFLLVLLLFLTWGFLTTLNDVLVAALRSLFRLSYHAATLVQFTWFFTCFAVSFPSASLLSRIGYRRTMSAGLAVLAAGAFCFAGATFYPTFAAFLMALAVLAAGSATLQAAAGPYVSLLGPAESAPRRFSLALAVNSAGSMLAPLFGAVFLLPRGGLSTLADARHLATPYLGIAGSLLLLAMVVDRASLPPLHVPVADPATSRPATYRALLQHPRLVFGVAVMFLYVGAEIGIGSMLLNFLAQPSVMALPSRAAALYASSYGGGAMLGRFLGWMFLGRFTPRPMLAGAATAACGLALTAALAHGSMAGLALLAIGLCNSVMVPILFTTAIAGLGPLTGKASGLLVAALIGGAVIPLAMGWIADRFGLHAGILLPVFCYLCVAIYAFLGVDRS